MILEKKKVEWYKKRLIFAKGGIQNTSDALAATQIKWKNELSQHDLISVHSLW